MIDIAPFGALCEHPCKLIGGAPVETHCAGHCELMMCELETETARLRSLVAELLPYAGDSCPDECRYRKECDSDSNLGTDGFPLLCVAYGHLLEKARVLGVDVSSATIERLDGAQADAQRPMRTVDAPAPGNAQLEDGAEQARALPMGK